MNTHDDLDRAQRWALLSPRERKAAAKNAMASRDLDTLWELTESFRLLQGSAGANLSPHTRRAYRRGISLLLASPQGAHLEKLTRDAAALWLRQMERAGSASATVGLRLAGARALYAALLWTNAVKADPFVKLRPAKDNTAAWEKRKPYSVEDLDTLLEAATQRQDLLLLLLCGHAGLRISEALAVTFKDVSLTRKEVIVQRGKGLKRRTVPASPRLVEEFGKIPAEERTGSVIPYRSDVYARERIRKLCETTGVEWLGLHAFRHTCGTRIIQSGGSLLDVSNMLGHSSTDTARLYGHWSDESLRDKLSAW